jgi:regulator of protease activity HflC (stomatin/prohibitin superfamily)
MDIERQLPEGACMAQASRKPVKYGCLGCMGLAVLALIITVLASIHELGPDEQLLVKDPSGHWVKNGPWSGVLISAYLKDVRKATLLQPEQYALVKDHLAGAPRHEAGPQLLFLKAYDELVEVKSKVVLHKDQYAVLKNSLSGEPRHEAGPMLLFPGVYDQVQEVKLKFVLQKDEYVILVDQVTGSERVVQGPQTFVPKSLEEATKGVQRANFLDTETACLVLDRSTGQERLVQEQGVYIPRPYEEVIEVRHLNHILPYEAVVVRDPQGALTVYNGADGAGVGTAFFLQPYHEILEQTWSCYKTLPNPGELQKPDIRKVTTIDMRSRKMVFAYEVRTSDNVKLVLEGTVFWKVLDVGQMISATTDPETDVWHHARSSLIEAVSNATLSTFMSSFNVIINTAWAKEVHASFYSDRGVAMESMELTRFDCVDAKTADILQEIIQETTNRINRLTAQESENEVRASQLNMDITLEKAKTALIKTKAENDRLQAQMQGESDGFKVVRNAATFIEGLNQSVPEIRSRVELYKLHQELASRNADTANLASGSAHLFLTPADMNLRLDTRGGAATSD